MKLHLLTVLFIVLLPPILVAQKKEEEMETDRPSQSLTPSVVTKNRVQVEAGFSREHYEVEGMKHDEYMYPSALIKYGLFKKLELRILIEDEADYDFVPEKQKTASGLDPIKVGLKYNLFDEKGMLPKTSVVARGSLPKAASDDFKGDFVAPLFRLVMENKLSDKISLVYNVGEQWEDDDVHGLFFYSACPQFEITDKFKAFAEVYGKLSSEDGPENVVDAGFLYQVKPNFQLDVSAGVGLSQLAPKNFLEVGLSFRLPK